MQLLIAIPALLAVISGAVAGFMLVRARSQPPDSPNRYLYRVAPLAGGAVLVWLLMEMDPLAGYLPSLYLMSIWVAFYHTGHYGSR